MKVVDALNASLALFEVCICSRAELATDLFMPVEKRRETPLILLHNSLSQYETVDGV